MKTTIRPLLETLEGRALLSAGALDPSFGNGGYVANSSLTPPAVATIQPWDGKSLLVGFDASSVGVSRYNTDGTPDTGFGTGGLATVKNVAGPYAVTTNPATQQIYVVGAVLVNGYYDYAVSRLNANGSLDTTFGTKGTVTVAVGKNNWDTPGAVAVDGLGRIIVLGSSTTEKGITYYDQDTILRFTTAGKLDTTFGTGGVVNGPLAAYSGDGWGAVQINPDNSLVVEGQDSGQHVIASYGPTGALQGRYVIQAPTNPYNTSQTIGVGNVAFQPNGDIVTLENYKANANSDLIAFLTRYTPTGTLDTTFGNGGLVVTDVTTALGDASGTPLAGAVGQLTIDPSGGVVIGGGLAPITIVNGQRTLGSYQEVLARYTSAGTLDTAFGNNGFTLASLGTYHDSAISSLAAQPDGNILAIGSSDPTSYGVNSVTTVARYLGDSNAPASSVVALPATSQPDPTIVSQILGDADFLNSLANGKRRSA